MPPDEARAGRPTITSAANPRIREAVRLRERRERARTGLTLVDGAREVARALDGGAEFVTAFVDGPALAAADSNLAERLRAASVPTTAVSSEVLAKLSFGDRSEGVVAVVRIPRRDLDGLVLPDDPLLVVVEGVEKPGNVGAILRSADGAGANGLIAADPRTDLYNPNAIRASLGTIFAVPVAEATSPATLDWLVAHGVRPVAARVDATLPYSDADLRGPVALVLGSEAHGLAETWNDPRVLGVRIPMAGIADSLNVSVAAAILLYEARRQRTIGGGDQLPTS
jgi:TrmH family RNA methyltransferase